MPIPNNRTTGAIIVPMPTQTPAPPSAERLLAEVTEHQQRLTALYRTLAERPLAHGVLTELRQALAKQDDQLRQLGVMVVEALVAGADPQLLAAALAPAAAPSPVEGPDAAATPPGPVEASDDAPATAQEPEPAPTELAEVPAPEPEPSEVSEPEPARTEPVPGPPAPAASLLALAQRGIGGARQHIVPEAPGFDPAPLRKLLDRLGQPTVGPTAAHVQQLLGRLQPTINAIDHWVAFPAGLQRDLLGLCSSLARHLQDEHPHGAAEPELRGLFRHMTRFSATERPGFVPGLSRHNAPTAESWLEDARRWHQTILDELLPAEAAQPMTAETALTHLEAAMAQGFDDGDALADLVQLAVEAGLSQSDKRLVDLLTPHQSLLRGTTGLKTLKTQLKKTLDDQEDFEAVQDAACPVPATWPHHHLTRGKVAVVLGGDSRPAALERLKSAFGFAELTWEGAEPRRTASVVRRVEQGSVDMVLLLLRFIHHSHTDVLVPACKRTGVPLVQVETGYGVDAVRRAIDKLPLGILTG